MGVAGYSGKPLAAKLGIKPGDVVLALNAPDHYPTLLHPLPEGAIVLMEAESPAVVHGFFRNAVELAQAAERIIDLPRPGGMLWVSWPK